MRLCVPRVHKHTLQSESCKHAVAQVASGSGDAKFLRQNQEWPKKVVFRRACRTHTLALSMIRAHTWLSVACLDCLQAPGEIAAGISLLPPWLLPSLLPSLLPLLPFSLPPPPSPHLRPHPRRPTREGGPPASGWRLVTTRARDSECGSIVHALRASAQSRAQPRLQTQKRQSGL